MDILFGFLIGLAFPVAFVIVVASLIAARTPAGVMAGIGEPTLLVRGFGSPHSYALRPSEATALARALEPITRSGDGSLALRDKTFEDRIQDVDRQIERFEERLAQRERTLIQSFTAMESAVARLQAQAGFLTSI